MARLYTYAQHFLRSPRLVAELVGHSNIRKNDLVYDLGAGNGVITSVLARRVREVVAVEIEPMALEKLRRNVQNARNVTILQKDILKLTPPNEPYKIFANVPFSLSAEIVRKFTSIENPPRSMYLITQKQFARKLVPGNDHFTSELAGEIGPLFAVRIRRPLRKTDFTPPPAVDTVLLELKQRETPLIAPNHMPAYREFVQRCFHSQTYFAATKRAKAGLSPELRPSQLTLDQWITLFTTQFQIEGHHE